ncbi:MULTISPECIES: SURF1 family protein [unclassified Pseudoclavibacter]|uniref:SURF1 family cytochrome oxidase biogenesis protein n=1 Tax=unclassified Pseudoclavibacter TaxID=2615177 RepID=UPI00130197A8|nr:MULTISPECIES: SURF1 family protein [unclassified Pseudoclavibacter]KAB1646345.1 SURF1 family protein [Pseudoclavibacter sp. CFCC 14310]KAB1663493.1 SURF1 family protein [Pseudoclavibacter sp. CFCC 13611]
MRAAKTRPPLLAALGKLRPWEWIGYLAGVIVFAVICVMLSRWQFDRRDQAVAEIAKVTNNWSAPAAELPDLVPGLDGFDDADEYRKVLLHGTYLTDEQLLVRNRPLNGQPGFEVLVPLRLDDDPASADSTTTTAGRVFFVNRGWLPTGSDGDAPADVPAPPSGEVEVVARLRPAQPEVDRSAPDGQIASFALQQVVDRFDLSPAYTAAYGQMESESPATADRPQIIPQPSLSEGSHLSYALQWIAFAVLAFVGFGYSIRQTLRRIEETGNDEVVAQQRRRQGSRRHDDDTDYEDALIDAAARHRGTPGE